MNCVICAIAKCENLYLYEWAGYHLNLGFSHIYIYDNNDIGGEHIDSNIFKEYSPRITIYDIRGKKYMQKIAYQNFYQEHDFDWCAFIDVDEFITFSCTSNISDINDFLIDKQNWEAIHLNWVCYGDNGRLLFNNKPVITRFPKPKAPMNFYYTYTNKPENSHIKSIVRKGLSIDWCHNDSSFSSNPHTPYGLNQICNPEEIQVKNEPFAPISISTAYIRHYTTKTVEEYIEKIKRQCADIESINFYSFPKFFRLNRPTIRKLCWIKKNYPAVKTRECLHEYIKFFIINHKLPLRFLFKSLSTRK